MSRFPPSMPEQTLCKRHQREALEEEKRQWMQQRAEAQRAEALAAAERAGTAGGCRVGPGESPGVPESRSAGGVCSLEGGVVGRTGRPGTEHPLDSDVPDEELNEMNVFLERVRDDLEESDLS